ncbi:MAG TPA: hypothetical protein VLK66_22140 [Longimicrobium sp.]|nr:hypothetical protein [Longimicrobium sp.]
MKRKNGAARKARRFDPVLAEAEKLIAEVDHLPPPQIRWTSRPPPDAEPRDPGNDWIAAIEPWLVDDGAYGTLARGRKIDFALRVEPLSLAAAEVEHPRALALGDDVYRIEARVTHREEDTCVLDFGLLGFVWFAPEWLQPGMGVAGEVALELDPDAYRAGWSSDEWMPAMIYPWRIDRVVLENAVRIPAGEADRIRSRNPELQTNSADARTLRDIDRPRVREDWPEGMMARYYLHCTLLSRIPRRPDARDRHPRLAAKTDA